MGVNRFTRPQSDRGESNPHFVDGNHEPEPPGQSHPHAVLPMPCGKEGASQVEPSRRIELRFPDYETGASPFTL